MTPKRCLNCDQEIIQDASHCYGCGQAVKEVKMTVGALLKDFLHNLFNLDGKIFLTLKKMWKPAFLTKEWVAGRRVVYFNPVRFFILMLILHFLLLSYDATHGGTSFNSDLDDILLEKMVESEILTQYDTLAYDILSDSDSTAIDSLRKSLFKDTKPSNMDTLLTNFKLGSRRFGDYGIIRKDAYEMEPDKLFDKYGVEHWLDQLIIKQTVRVTSNIKGLVPFMIGNMTWVVILTLFAVAGLMWLLYFRNAYYYVEHAVLLLFYHAKTFFVLNMILVITIFSNLDEGKAAAVNFTGYMLSAIYLLVTIKMYYQQGWFKTITKYGIIGGFYVFLLMIFTAFVFAIGAAIF